MTMIILCIQILLDLLLIGAVVCLYQVYQTIATSHFNFVSYCEKTYISNTSKEI